MTEPHNDWTKLFDELPIDAASRDHHQQGLKRQVLAAFEASPPQPVNPAVNTLKSIGRMVMQNRILQWAIVGVCLVGLGWLLQIGGQPAFAIDRMVERIVNAKTARWDMQVRIVGHRDQVVKVSTIPGRCRQEFDFQTVIIDQDAGKMLSLVPASRLAIVTPLTSLSDAPGQFGAYDPPNDGLRSPMPNPEFVNQFETIRAALQNAMKNPDKDVTPLGNKVFDGRDLTGFEFNAMGQQIIVWADPKSEFPVRIELALLGPPRIDMVMKNYELDVELDEALFSVDIPDGYKVLEQEAPPLVGESDFLESLRLCCQTSSGDFPPSLGVAAIAEVSARYMSQLLQKKQLKVEDLTGDKLHEMTKISRGFSFSTLLGIDSDADAHYAGKGVKLNDKDRPIFWYRPKGTDSYRVIYADLSVQEQAVAPRIEGAVKVTM